MVYTAPLKYSIEDAYWHLAGSPVQVPGFHTLKGYIKHLRGLFRPHKGARNFLAPTETRMWIPSLPWYPKLGYPTKYWIPDGRMILVWGSSPQFKVEC